VLIPPTVPNGFGGKCTVFSVCRGDSITSNWGPDPYGVRGSTGAKSGAPVVAHKCNSKLFWRTTPRNTWRVEESLFADAGSVSGGDNGQLLQPGDKAAAGRGRSASVYIRPSPPLATTPSSSRRFRSASVQVLKNSGPFSVRAANEPIQPVGFFQPQPPSFESSPSTTAPVRRVIVKNHSRP